MKLYVWQPKNYGQMSFFTIAPDEKSAEISVAQYIQQQCAEDDSYTKDEAYGWGTDAYTLIILDVGEVITQEYAHPFATMARNFIWRDDELGPPS